MLEGRAWKELPAVWGERSPRWSIGLGSPGRNKLKSGCMTKSGSRSPCRVMPPEVMRPTKVGRLVRKTSGESRAQEAGKVNSKKQVENYGEMW